MPELDLKSQFEEPSKNVVVLSEVETKDIELPARITQKPVRDGDPQPEPYLVYITRLAKDADTARDVLHHFDQKLRHYEGDVDVPNHEDAAADYLRKTARAFVKDCIRFHEQKNDGFNPENGIKRWLASAGRLWDINDSMCKVIIPATNFVYSHATADVEGVPRLSEQDLIQKYFLPAGNQPAPKV